MFFLGGPGGLTSKIEKLKAEKIELQAEVSALRNQLEDQQRHRSGLGAALLHEKLECQERKLAVLELASQVLKSLIFFFFFFFINLLIFDSILGSRSNNNRIGKIKND